MTVPRRSGTRGGGGFARLWGAAAVSNLGDGLRLAAFPLLAASLTRDPALVAGLTVAVRLPWLVWALPAGALADRALRQSLVPDHLLGRVTAAMRLVGAGALPAGAALGGVLASELGLRAPFVLAAGGMLLVVVLAWPTINNAAINRALAAI